MDRELHLKTVKKFHLHQGEDKRSDNKTPHKKMKTKYDPKYQNHKNNYI